MARRVAGMPPASFVPDVTAGVPSFILKGAELLGLVGHQIIGSTYMKGFLLLLLSLSISYAQQAQPGPGGVITGVLRGDNGAAIIGAYVSLHLLPPYPLGRERAREWFTTTAGGGAFRFNAPYYGRYR